MDHFKSINHYRQFVFAKSFYFQDREFLYHSGWFEKFGKAIVLPIGSIADGFLRNFRNPLMIVALTIVAIAAVTIAFYPAQFVATIGTFAPFLLKITPQMLQFSLYTITQASIVGLCMRTLGRLNNPALMAAWDANQLTPIPIGAVIHP